LKFFQTIVFICGIPKRLSQKLHEAIDDWSEMAPYRIRLMSQSVGSLSSTGMSALKKPQGPFDPNTYRDDFTRREMLCWRFIDYDRMMFGKHDPITARQWLNLGDLYWEHRRPGDAAVFYRKGLKIFQIACVNTDERLIAAQKKMANCYLMCGDYAEAEKLLNAIAIAIAAKQSAIDESAASAGSSSSTCAASAKSSSSGPEKPSLRAERITNLIVLAETLKKQRKFHDAAVALHTVIDLHEADGSLPGDECLAIYRELSETYTALGDPEKAELFISTARQLDFMRIVEKAVGAEARTLIRELGPLAALYLKRNKTAIVRGLRKRIEICELVDKVKTYKYPGIERDLERLAILFDERNHPGDATTSFHLRARAKRLIEEASTKLSVFGMIMASKLYWLLEAVEGMEPLIATMMARLF
jgi:tetratricopeptide (TPR) repeat protein